MILMILPLRPCSIIDLATCLVNRNAPPRIISSCRRHSSSGISITPFLLRIRGFFMRKPPPPKRPAGHFLEVVAAFGERHLDNPFHVKDNAVVHEDIDSAEMLARRRDRRDHL